jgi:hypothetical protein
MWGSATVRPAGTAHAERKPVVEFDNARLQEQAHSRPVRRAIQEDNVGGGDGWPQRWEGTTVVEPLANGSTLSNVGEHQQPRTRYGSS